MTAPEIVSTPEKASLMEDLIDILFSPAKVFARRGSGSAWGVFLIVTILVSVLAFVNAGTMQGVMDAEVNRAVAEATAANPNMTEEQLNGMRGIMEMSMKWGVVIMMPILLCLLGVIIWLVGRLMGGQLGFGTGVMIASFAFVPRVVEGMLVAIQALLLDTSGYTSRFAFSLGVGRFMDSSGKQGMINLLGRIDLFTIWVTILIALGLAYSAKVEKSKAYLGAGLIWVLGATPAIWMLIQGK